MADTKNYTEFDAITIAGQDDLHLLWDTGLGANRKITVAKEQQSAAEHRSFNIAPSSPPTTEGMIYWDAEDHTLNVTTDQTDVILQTGQEMQVRVTNKSGVDIDNGDVVYISGAQGQRPTIAKALSTTSTTIKVIGVATHAIPDNQNGIVTAFGLVRGVDTSTFSDGDEIWVDGTTAGDLTNVKPSTPLYPLFVGYVLVAAVDGKLLIHPESTSTSENALKGSAFNGFVQQNFALAVTSDGATITASLSAASGNQLTCYFSDRINDVDVTTPLTVTVTAAGADTTPLERWLYLVPGATVTDDPVLTESTTAFPATEHIKIARLVVQTASGVQANGLLKQHNYTNAVTSLDKMGELDHISTWIRLQHATWLSGTALTVSGTGTATIGTALTSGQISQLHAHTFAAQSDPATMFVVNDFTTAYNKITNLADIVLDSAGNTLVNKWYTLVLWAVASETGSGGDKLMINVPSGSYNTVANANADANNYANTSIPAAYKGTGFLIAKIVLRNNASTTWTYDNTGNNDLRGLFPDTQVGSSSGSATAFSDSTFEIFNAADNTKELVWDVSGVTTATQRTWIAQDINMTPIGKDGSSTNVDALTSKIVNVVDPTANQDAATKLYVDSHTTNGIWQVAANIITPKTITDALNIRTLDADSAVGFNFGTTTTTFINIGRSGIPTTVQGNLIVDETIRGPVFSDGTDITKTLAIDVSGIGSGIPRTWTAQNFNMTVIGRNASTTEVDALTSKIINVVDPTANQHAATKLYVDTHAANGIWTRAAGIISPTTTTDDVALFDDLLGYDKSVAADPWEIQIRKDRADGAVVNADYIGRTMYFGHDGSTYVESARVEAQVSNTVATGQVPSELNWYTTNTVGTFLRNMWLSSEGVLSTTGNIVGGANIDATGKYTVATDDAIIRRSASTWYMAGGGNETSTGANNIGIGNAALDDQTTGTGNIGIGSSALSKNTAQSNNIAIGSSALINQTFGNDNVAIGTLVASTNTGGSDNVYIGALAGQSTQANASRNVVVGYAAGHDCGDDNVFIGYNVGNTLVNPSDKLWIDNSNTTSPLIEGDFNLNTLKINGTLESTGILYSDDIDRSTSGVLTIGATNTTGLELAATGVTTTAKGGLTISDAQDIVLNTTTGTKIGTATTQKLAFYNSTPIIQQSSTGETVGFTAGAGTGVNDDSTFTGNVGATAYRLSDIVKHLKNLGLIAV